MKIQINQKYSNKFPQILMRKVAYLYNEAITNYTFSKQHPMKTKRLKMVHSLIQQYGLTSNLNMFQSKQATSQEIRSFHDPKFVDYLESWVSPKKEDIIATYKEMKSQYDPKAQERRKIRDDETLKAKFKVNQSFDCPGFEGLFNYCQLAVGGSIDAADLIITGITDVAINWGGGLHHAKKNQASGFCYVNDIVLCILELLKRYPRVLYLDIDVHHGDGVQEAFYHTNRVMTVSFHEYEQDFFPGTGALDSVGEGIGKYFSVNVPLKRGIDDTSYFQIFKQVMSIVMASYRPDALVIQCGADSLSRDKLGHLNLSIQGHSQCIKHMLEFGLPVVMLGGGGYTIQNVSRCWAYETATAIGTTVDNCIPEKDAFYALYESDKHKLLFTVEERKNQNSQEYLDNIVKTIRENIRMADIRPSVAFHQAPKYFLPEEELQWSMINEDSDSLQDSLCDRVYKSK